MNITIVGAGRVGIHLAKYFINEHQDVYLVDRDIDKLSILESDFNMRTFAGEPVDFKVLREAKADKADIFVAVTAETSENLVACALAKSMGAKKTIARVDKYDFMEPANTGVVKRMGVDHVVFPDLLSAFNVINALEHPWCRSWSDFGEGRIFMAAVSVRPEAPWAGIRLKELFSHSTLMHVSALRCDHSTIIPRGDDIIQPGDILYVTFVPHGLDVVMELAGKTLFPVRKVLILGGSTAAEIVAKISSREYSLVVMEKNLARGRELAANCRNIDVIYGDGSEEDVLEEAGINSCDAFVALSDSSERNILACLTAKEAGVRRTIAEVEKEQFISKAETFNIGSIINKPILTANAIFQIILDSGSVSSRCMAMTDAEVARLIINENSYLATAPVMQLKLPRELTFAGMIRDGHGEIVTGSTQFRPGDDVIVFCLNGALDKVEKLFGK